MILTISSQDTDLSDSIAVALANRRADAGRNVLLLCKKNLDKSSSARIEKNVANRGRLVSSSNWLATEMKAGAKPRDLPDYQVVKELASAFNQHRDIVIDMPSLDDIEASSLLAFSGLVLFVLQVSTWSQLRQNTLIQQLKVARSCKLSLPILMVVDEQDTAAGQALTKVLNAQIPDLHLIGLSHMSEMSISALYRFVYLRSV